jgi:hypothetical protein
LLLGAGVIQQAVQGEIQGKAAQVSATSMAKDAFTGMAHEQRVL